MNSHTEVICVQKIQLQIFTQGLRNLYTCHLRNTFVTNYSSSISLAAENIKHVCSYLNLQSSILKPMQLTCLSCCVSKLYEISKRKIKNLRPLSNSSSFRVVYFLIIHSKSTCDGSISHLLWTTFFFSSMSCVI